MYIGNVDSDRISLLAEVNRISDDDTIDFYVLNGAWEGTFKDNIVHVLKTNSNIPSKILWYGCLPKECRDYNDGIEYIIVEVSKLQQFPKMADVLTDFRKYLSEIEAEDHDDEIPF